MYQGELPFTDEGRTRNDQIFDAFLKFYKANPAVWKLFVHYANKAVAEGRRNYAATLIFEQMRWHTGVETVSKEVKINNNFKGWYARVFHWTYPAHDGLFRLRRLKSKDRPAYKHDRQVFIDGPPEDEDRYREIIARLGIL